MALRDWSVLRIKAAGYEGTDSVLSQVGFWKVHAFHSLHVDCAATR
jgi:hypothetical protein